MDERTNPTDIPNSSFVPGTNTKTPQAQQLQADQKKKQPANVRKVLYARKTLKDWLEELVSVL
jgi:zinc finger HIT domain-containing protein 1